MITLNEAEQIVISNSITMEKEIISFERSLNRVLAQDVYADMDSPPFDRSAMDGFAIQKGDIQNELSIIGTIQAGQHSELEITPGACARIMTGAKIPKGADMVVMIEKSIVEDDKVRFEDSKSAKNIRFKGEDGKKGDVVLNQGTIIQPHHIAILATVGCVNVEVSKKIKVGIISTGDELVNPSITPVDSQIRNSNSQQIAAQINSVGGNASLYGIVPDKRQFIRDIILKALAENDGIILSGGVSMGEYDYVPEILAEIGVTILFQKVKVKPGKPTLFGKKENKFVFGLPGNPVSSLVQFELLVKPFIMKCLQANFLEKIIKAKLLEDIIRKKTGMDEFVPVIIESNGIKKVPYHGSAHIFSYAHANGIIHIPADTKELKKGEWVDVRPI